MSRPVRPATVVARRAMAPRNVRRTTPTLQVPSRPYERAGERDMAIDRILSLPRRKYRFATTHQQPERQLAQLRRPGCSRALNRRFSRVSASRHARRWSEAERGDSNPRPGDPDRSGAVPTRCLTGSTAPPSPSDTATRVTHWVTRDVLVTHGRTTSRRSRISCSPACHDRASSGARTARVSSGGRPQSLGRTGLGIHPSQIGWRRTAGRPSPQ